MHEFTVSCSESERGHLQFSLFLGLCKAAAAWYSCLYKFIYCSLKQSPIRMCLMSLESLCFTVSNELKAIVVRCSQAEVTGVKLGLVEVIQRFVVDLFSPKSL